MYEIFSFANLFIFVLCYIIGSFPAAYILVKKHSNKDLTKEGSKNVGTLNSFVVSKSKIIAISVLILDLLKGALPVYFILFVINYPYISAMIAAVALILGHNYPVWLKFKGGRGLATGAGIFLVINFFIVIAWCIVWLGAFIIKKKVLIANTAATFGLPLYIAVVNLYSFFQIHSSVAGFSLIYFNIFSIIITLIILSKHTEVFK